MRKSSCAALVLLTPAAHALCIGASLPHASYAVVHDDGITLAVDKDAGLLTVPGIGPTKQDCLLTRLQADGYKTVKHAPHRLDRDTSGLLILGQNPLSHKKLCVQVRVHDACRLCSHILQHMLLILLRALRKPGRGVAVSGATLHEAISSASSRVAARRLGCCKRADRQGPIAWPTACTHEHC